MRKVLLRESELEFATSRSGGPGGQNVNKVETRVTVSFDLAASGIFSASEKSRIFRNSAVQRRLDAHGRIVITAREHRTQALNRAEAISRLTELLELALVPIKHRVATKPTRASKVRRREDKAKRSTVKGNRRGSWRGE